ncbi:MAG TPA: murein biosynthesis integral membrane protein MurJ [Acetobacteraceae bacterium]|jgi:putative peptidoglycan lipid II flippase
MLRNALTVGGWTMASRVLGFARDMLIAAMLGAGPVADAFFVALKLPNLFRRLFGEGAFNAAFVPAFSGLLAAEGRPSAHRFAEETFAVMAFWLGALTIIGEVFMPQMMAVLAPGFEAIPAKFELAVALSRITFPYLLLICLAALVSGVLNGLERFTAASASYVLFNVISIAFMLWLTPYVPTAGHALSWGVTAAGVAQLALLLWAMRRAGMGLRLPRPRLTPQVRMLLRRMLPGLVGAGVTQLNLAVDVIIASLLPPGTVSLLYYADRVQQLPLGVIGTAVGTALLPLLSRQVRAGEGEASLGTLNRAIEYALFLTLPAAVALVVSAWPVMSVLFGRGAFDAESVRLSAQSLAAYALGLPAFVLVKVVAPGFFARDDMATPVKIGVAAVALNLAMNVVFNLGYIVSSLGVTLPGTYVDRLPALAHVGPALATSLAAIFNVGCLGVLLARHGHLRPDAQLRRRAVRMAAAAAAMGLALAATQHVLFAVPLHGVMRVGALAALVGVGLVVYGGAAMAFGAGDRRELGRMLGRRRRGRMDAGVAVDTVPRR